MPYEKIPDQDQPELPRDVKIWRYLDLAKFASLLSSKGLYFAQVPHLGDPFEGSLVQDVIDNAERSQPIIARDYPEFVRTREERINAMMTARAYTYASCWHQNDYESAAMWDLYARDGFGVAVRSTIGRLVDSVERVPERVWIGQINYHDYATAKPPGNSLWTPMFQKRMSFRHEQEVRAVVMDWDRMQDLRGKWSYEENPVMGRTVAADLKVLIETFYLAPTAPSWYKETVAKIVEAFGFSHVPIVQSDMNARPAFV